MKHQYDICALQLLIAGTRLSIRAERLLNALLTLCQVALSGEPTMVPSAKLLDLPGFSWSVYTTKSQALNEITWILGELAHTPWATASARLFSKRAILDHYQLSDNTIFIHFKVDRTFVLLLDQIGQNLSAKCQDTPGEARRAHKPC